MASGEFAVTNRLLRRIAHRTIDQEKGVNNIEFSFMDSGFEAKSTVHSFHTAGMKLKGAQIHAAFDMNLPDDNLSLRAGHVGVWRYAVYD